MQAGNTSTAPEESVAFLMEHLHKLPHPGGKELNLVLFQGAPDSVRRTFAESIVHCLRQGGFMPAGKRKLLGR